MQEILISLLIILVTFSQYQDG